LTKRREKAAPTPLTGRHEPWTDIDEEGGHLNIDHFLTFQLTRLAHAARSNVTRRYLADFDLTVPEWRLLAMTARCEPVRFSKLAADSSMDKGQASRTVRGMIRRGYIASTWRAAEARESAAILMLRMTPKGRTLYQEVLPVAQRSQARMLQELTRAERQVLHRVLGKLFMFVEAGLKEQ
jgi:DNA-binding MarR family transcriptional regulator